MDYAFDPIVNNPKKFSIFFLEGFGFASLGLLAGSSIDAIFVKLSKKTTMKQTKLALVVLQVVISVIFMYVVWTNTKKSNFAEHWQDTIPGMAFPAFFFGIQSNIYSTIQSFYL